MTYRVEYKTSPTSSWAGYGGGYSEGQAYTALERAKGRGVLARIVDSRGHTIAVI